MNQNVGITGELVQLKSQFTEKRILMFPSFSHRKENTDVPFFFSLHSIVSKKKAGVSRLILVCEHS